MAFISTVAPADAQGKLRELYQKEQQAWGFVPNYAKVFSHRPHLMPVWASLQKTIRQTIDDETYELATLAAARSLGSSYCSLAHGKKLAERYFTEEEVTSLSHDVDSPVLSRKQKAVMRLAANVVRDATSVSQKDIDELRLCGCDDGEIFDIVATAAARCFFAKLVDALGACPDACFDDLAKELKFSLGVGRKISREEPEALPD